MKRRRSSFPIRSDVLRAGAVAALVVIGCQSSPSAVTSGPAPTMAPASKPAHPALSLEYLEVLTGGATNGEAEPLIVALHGLGARPDNFIDLFDDFPAKARIIAPHSHTPFSDGFQWFAPYGATSDESAPGMSKAADEVGAFIDEAAKAFPTLGTPIVIGFSQGGALSYAIAVRHPTSVAASFPISGWLPPPLFPDALPAAAPAIFAFHGNADERVPLERDQSAVSALEKLGYHVTLKIANGVPHAIPPEVRKDVFAALATEVDAQRSKGAQR